MATSSPASLGAYHVLSETNHDNIRDVPNTVSVLETVMLSYH